MLTDISAKSLKTRLGQDAQLVEHIAPLWGIDPAKLDIPAAISLLMERMRDHFWARGVWTLLEEEEQGCLFQALAAGGDRSKGVPLERLRKRAKLAPDVLEGAILRLVARGLLEEGEVAQQSTTHAVEILRPAFTRAVFVYREPAEALYSTGQELFTPALDRSRQPLERLIGSRSAEQLRQLAYLCHIPRRQLDQVRTPYEIERLVSEALVRPLTVFDLLHHAEREAQELFLWLYRQEGHAPVQEVYRTFGREPERLHALFAQLERNALAFDGLTQADERVVFIHETVLHAIKDEARDYLADQRAHAFFPLLSAPSVKQEGQPLICYDLTTIVGSVWQSCIEPTREGVLPKRLSAKIRPLLQGLPRIGEGQLDLYVDMLFGAAQGLDLLCCVTPFGEEKPRYQPGPGLSQWSQYGTEEQIQRFLRWWTKSASWHDVHASGKLIYPSASGAPAARQAVLAQLRQCVPGQWYGFDALLFACWQQQPLIPYDGPYGASATERRTSVASRREQWMRSQRPLYAALISSTLHECGVVSLGFALAGEGGSSGGVEPDLFMLTELGAAALTEATKEDASPPAFAADQRSLILQPNGDLILQPPHQWDVLYQLLQFSQIIHVGPVSTFKLTQAAVLRGLEAGLSIEGMLAFLAQHCRHDIPQNVEYNLTIDWPKGHHF